MIHLDGGAKGSARLGAAEATGLSQRAKAVAAHLDRRTMSQPVLAGLIRLVDAALAVVLGVAAYQFAPGATTSAALLPPLVAAGLLVLFVQGADGYDIHAVRSFTPQFRVVVGSWTLVFVIFLVALLLLNAVTPELRQWFGAWYVAGLVGLPLWRAAMAIAIRRWAAAGRLERRAIVVGGGKPTAELIERLESTPGNDIGIYGIFDDRGDRRSPPLVSGYPKLGTIAELVDFARVARIDLLIISLPLSAESRLREILTRLWVLPVDIRLAAHTDKLGFRSRASRLGPIPVVDVADRPIAHWNALIKRCFDVVVGTLALAVLSPVMIAAAIAIKLDSPGPVFFEQRRYGFNNEIVNVLKFRSLHHAARDVDARRAVTRDDPRVTRVGRFIRRTSIDELPQLINVLRGELSLVGPRAHALQSNTGGRTWEQLVDGYFARHRVKPGLTGWAQVNGWRGEIDDPEKLRQRLAHDLYYIENWSLLLDILILLRTPVALLKGENAY